MCEVRRIRPAGFITGKTRTVSRQAEPSEPYYGSSFSAKVFSCRIIFLLSFPASLPLSAALPFILSDFYGPSLTMCK